MNCWDDDTKSKEDKLLYDHFAKDNSALIARIAGKAILFFVGAVIVWKALKG